MHHLWYTVQHRIMPTVFLPHFQAVIVAQGPDFYRTACNADAV